MKFQSKSFRVNGIEMNIVIAGQGTDVLLIHGLLSTVSAALIATSSRSRDSFLSHSGMRDSR